MFHGVSKPDYVQNPQAKQSSKSCIRGDHNVVGSRTNCGSQSLPVQKQHSGNFHAHEAYGEQHFKTLSKKAES
jgi:hypothetical protein